MEILLQVVLLALGFAMLTKGADWFVDGSAGIASKFGIPQLVIGLTIVAMGTSAPEAAVSISAALKGNADITIGNVVGSNILNVLIILGLAAIFSVLKVQKSTIKYEIPLMIGMTFLLLIVGENDSNVGRLEGVILWLFFIGYIAYLFVMAMKDKKDKTVKEMSEAQEEPVGTKKPPMLLLLTAVGLVLIVWGSNVTVDAATAIAQAIGLSERFIGLTIVALGTSLPELFTSVAAARKGNVDIAIGNIVGSNLFNILFVVGTAALITPVVFTPSFAIDTLVAAAVCVMLWACVRKDGELGKKEGIVMLVCYGLYFLYLLTN